MYVRNGRIKSNFCPCQNNTIISKKDVRQRLLKNNPLFSNGKHFTPHMAEAINPIDFLQGNLQLNTDLQINK